MDAELIRRATESHFLESWQILEDSDSFDDFIDGVRLYMCTNKKAQEDLQEILNDFDDVFDDYDHQQRIDYGA